MRIIYGTYFYDYCGFSAGAIADAKDTAGTRSYHSSSITSLFCNKGRR
ncbi:hypothetical protein FDUTEX481_05195 [Tolypothrix sp. PCC 7601]|nr:hypothetical protein FDUTEX481_05195 [Tolypothrix sp. PCC 7601]